MDYDVQMIGNQQIKMGMGKRKIVEKDNEEDIDHIFKNQDCKYIQDMKPFFVEYTKHKFQNNIAKDKKNSYYLCENLDKVKERNRRIDMEEIRQIIKENKKLKEHARNEEIKINILRREYGVVIV